MNKDMNDLNRPQTPDTKTSSLRDKIGDAIEGIGHKVSELGLPKVGQKIHDLGDNMEKDHDDPSHPHDV